METTNELLDQIKARYSLKSDYALAKLVGLSRERISKYRTIGGELGEDATLRVAELLDLDPAYVLACTSRQRAKSEAIKAAWERMADLVKTHGAAAVFALLAVAPTFTPTPANAAPNVATDRLCILCKIRRLLVGARSRLDRSCRFTPLYAAFPA